MELFGFTKFRKMFLKKMLRDSTLFLHFQLWCVCLPAPSGTGGHSGLSKRLHTLYQCH